MKHLMVDVETLGTSVNAPIIQIGACFFNPTNGEIRSQFLANIDIDSVLQHGFLPDGGTISWWLGQSSNARESLFDGGSRPLIEVLEDFNDFWEGAEKVWSHATFDFPLIMNHLHVVGLRPKVHFKAARDLRTIVDLTDVDLQPFFDEAKGIHHNALDDCKAQIQYFVKCFNVTQAMNNHYQVQNDLIKENARIREELHALYQQGPDPKHE